MSRWSGFVAALRTVAARSLRVLKRTFTLGIQITGICTLVLVVLAFTRVPFDAHRWLGSAAGECDGPVDLIVVLGGSGMPSGPELVRLYRASEVALQWPSAKVLIMHPGPPSALNAMGAELELRGVGHERITLVNEGNNTREQALLLHERMAATRSLAIVTSPENTYRSVLAFRKAEFAEVCGVPAWDHAMMHNFDYAHGAIGGRSWVPDVSGSPDMRYTFWNYLKLEIICLREYVALAYYRLNGWV